VSNDKASRIKRITYYVIPRATPERERHEEQKEFPVFNINTNKHANQDAIDVTKIVILV
jgi:hypothetical protein